MDALISKYNHLETPIAESPTLRKDLWVTTLNCGSLSEANSFTQINKAKLSTICWQFQRCDLTSCTSQTLGSLMSKGEERLTSCALYYRRERSSDRGAVETHAKLVKTPHKRHWKKRTAAPSPIQPTSQRSQPHERIGGMLLIVSNKWSKHIKD
jgi:hypothetical protein